MQKLTDIIGKRLNQHKLGDAAQASQVIFRSNQLLKAQFKVNSSELKAVQLKNGVLHVGSVSAVWSQEMWGYQADLLAELQEEFGKKLIQSVRMIPL